MKTDKKLTVIGLFPLKNTVELMDENKNIFYWKLGTTLKINDYKIGMVFKTYNTRIEQVK